MCGHVVAIAGCWLLLAGAEVLGESPPAGDGGVLKEMYVECSSSTWSCWPSAPRPRRCERWPPRRRLPRPPNLKRVKEDLLAAGEQDPTNEEVRRELTVLKKEMKDARQKKKAALDGLFGRGF
ncbi:hypothetical protein PR003_g24180 [Phytophthora rubi]|uniref:RxLR effector protein n=1 Tax=Phytophthora rubi TaxID=129364 RepID=A0A6A3IJL5_9STRA|nr:hypothetical protein PR002_g24034 [Phytophthora rubi]KAE8981822.1 hypothetical protein PR001_g23894 [Phytophthora rubi]KAE9294783.1 hypothetical protein PR003_g24180 [Phytophthora rubi]